MKEITRIHIAKVSYEAETSAKKQLDGYLKTLEAYSNDTEIIDDVEIRITEILAERGVAKNDVITEADVTALKDQLGEPREFMTDEDVAIDLEDAVKIGDPSRKLYRDPDHAVIGGVLSGIAAFFKINPLWVRLIFVLLALASFGTMLLVYVVLWIAVPAATSAADKLQMAGRPVTVNSIRELNENEITKPQNTRVDGRRVATMLLGILFVIGGIGSALVTIAAIVVAIFRSDTGSLFNSAESNFFFVGFVLAVISGLLFTGLMVLGAYASFAQKLTKRVVISSCIIIILGFVSFCAAFAAIRYDGELRQETIAKNTRESQLTVPKDIRLAKHLVANTPGMKVVYVTVRDSELPQSSVRLFDSEGREPSEVDVTMQDGILTVQSDRSIESACTHPWCEYEMQEVTIYGPALQGVTAGTDTKLEYESGEQKELKITSIKNSDVALSGNVESLRVEAGDGSVIDASSAVVRDVRAGVNPSVQLLLGTVEKLTVGDKKACPAHDREARVSVQDVTSGTMTFNGKEQSVKSLDSGCTEITIESEDEK